MRSLSLRFIGPLILVWLGVNAVSVAEAQGPFERLRDRAQEVAGQIRDRVEEVPEEVEEWVNDPAQEDVDRESRARDAAPSEAEKAPAASASSVASPDSRSVQEPFFGATLAPQGIKMGMPLAETKGRLDSLGFTSVNALGCRFERLGSDRSRIEIVLSIANASSAGGVQGRQDGEANRLQQTCAAGAEEDFIVTGLTYKEFVERASSSVDPVAEVEQLVGRLGPYVSCARLASYGANACVWYEPVPEIESLTVTISRSWGREVRLEGNPIEIFPVIPERARDAEAMAQQALALCESSEPHTVYAVVHDCQCVARKVGEAYARGQVSEIDPSALMPYDDGCPSSRETLRTFLEEQCLVSGLAREEEDWALGGGCRCASEHGGDAYLANPRSNYSALLSGVSASALACGWRPGGNAVVPEQYRAAANRADDAGEAAARSADFVAVGATPAGMRPLEMWLLDGRAVVHEKYQPITALDQRFDYSRQQRATERFLNLLLIEQESELLSIEGAARTLAGENLADDERDQLLERCQIDYSAAATCRWKADDEFGRRALRETFLERFGSALGQMGRPLPTGVVYVQDVKLEDYDAGRGGFPIEIVRHRAMTHLPLRPFNLADRSLFGHNTLIQGVTDGAVEYPELWPLSSSEAEAMLSRLANRRVGSESRVLKLAWLFDVVRTEAPQREYSNSKRDVVLTLRGSRLYGDARLTDEIAELGAGGSAAPSASGTADSAEEPASGLADGGTTGGESLPIRPLRFETLDGRVLLEPTATGSHPLHEPNVRYLNLLVVEQTPSLARDPAAALALAQQNLIGVAMHGKWMGNNEFERQKTSAAYQESGARQVVDLARQVALPQEVVIRTTVTLEEYDFDRQGFPMRPGRQDLGHVAGFSVVDPQLKADYGTGVLRRGLIRGSAFYVQWSNTAGPLFLHVSPDEARSIVKDHAAAPGGLRRLFAGTTAKLHRLLDDSEQRRPGLDQPVFEGELLDVSLYWDRELNDKVASLALAPR